MQTGVIAVMGATGNTGKNLKLPANSPAGGGATFTVTAVGGGVSRTIDIVLP